MWALALAAHTVFVSTRRSWADAVAPAAPGRTRSHHSDWPNCSAATASGRSDESDQSGAAECLGLVDTSSGDQPLAVRLSHRTAPEPCVVAAGAFGSYGWGSIWK